MSNMVIKTEKPIQHSAALAPANGSPIEDNQAIHTAARKSSTTVKNVLFVARSFPPNLEMGAQTCGQIARYLPLYGWQPVVLTVEDDYIEEEYRDRRNTGARDRLVETIIKTRQWLHPFDFYRLIKRSLAPGSEGNNGGAATAARQAEESMNLGDQGGARQLALSLLSIPDQYTGWLAPAVLSGWRAVNRCRAKVIFSSGPCWTNHLVGYSLSLLTGLPWVKHYRDPWMTGQWSGNPNRISESVNRKLERMTTGKARAVICVTEEHAALFRATYPQMPANKFISVPNGFDGAEWESYEDSLNSSDRSAGSQAGKFLITYAGKFYVKRDPLPFFRAMRALIETGDVARDEIEIDLVGWCETSEGRSVREMIKEVGLDGCVNMVGPVSRDKTIHYLTRSDLLLLLAEAYTIQVPGKTFEYLKTGRPILALTSEGSVARLIRDTGAGWSVDPGDHQGMVTALREAYRYWKNGEPGRTPNPEKVAGYDRRITTGRIASLFDSLSQADD